MELQRKKNCPPKVTEVVVVVVSMMAMLLARQRLTPTPFFTRNFDKKYPFYTSIRKTFQSFWTSCFELVHCDWVVYFLTKLRLAFLTNDFE